APGRRSGPNTTSATRPTSSSSEKPISNMGRGSVLACRLFDLLRLGVEGLRLVQLLAGRRGGLLRLGRLVVVAVHGLAEALDGFAQVGAQVLEAFGAEYQNHHDQDDDPVFPIENAHAISPRSEFRKGRVPLSRRARKGRSAGPARPARPADAGPGRRVWFRPTLRRPSPESCSGPCGTGWQRRSCPAPHPCALPAPRPGG